jgi:hypothetical protein
MAVFRVGGLDIAKRGCLHQPDGALGEEIIVPTGACAR